MTNLPVWNLKDFYSDIKSSKIKNDLGWEPNESFESGIRKTLKWYLDNETWTERVISGEYKLERLGKIDGN